MKEQVPEEIAPEEIAFGQIMPDNLEDALLAKGDSVINATHLSERGSVPEKASNPPADDLATEKNLANNNLVNKTNSPVKKTLHVPLNGDFDPNAYRSTTSDVLRETLRNHQDWMRTNGEAGQQADLRGVNLAGADLRKANFEGVLLDNANLHGANLEGARMQGASLNDADLTQAFLHHVDLRKAYLSGANMTQVFLNDADLEGAFMPGVILVKAGLRGTKLARTDMRGADLKDTGLRGIDFSESCLRGAVFAGASIRQCNLAGADLVGTNFQGTLLKESDLSNTILSKANFRQAILKTCKFVRSRLDEADFRGANLQECRFNDAWMHEVQMEQARGLKLAQLKGADLSHAVLPSNLDLDQEVGRIATLVHRIRRLFGLMTLIASWMVLLLAGTTDLNLVLDSGSMPFIGENISWRAIYALVPFSIFVVFLHVHLYLQRLWESLAVLPAVFPTGRPLDQMVDPWLPISVARSFVDRIQSTARPFMALQKSVAIMVVWVAFPIFIILTTTRYLVAQDAIVSGFQFLILFLTLWASATFYRNAQMTLQGDARGPLRWHRKVSRRHTFTVLATLGLIMSIWGGLFFSAVPLPGQQLNGLDLSNVHFEGQRFENANFYGANLSGTYFTFGTLPRADFRNANLQNAHLNNTDLYQAKFTGANLTGVNLVGARRLTAKQLCSAKSLFGARLAGRLAESTRELCIAKFDFEILD